MPASLGDPVIASGETGVACGSSTGSTPDIKDFAAMMHQQRRERPERQLVRAHDAAHHRREHRHLLRRAGPDHSDVERLHLRQPGHRLRLRGDQVRPQTLMLAGGAEELCPTEAMAFDTLYATSRRNDAPQHDAASLRSRPRRPGRRRRRGRSWCSKSWSTRSARGARIHAELVGFGTQLRRRARHQARRSDHAHRDGARAARRRARAAAPSAT